MSHEESWRLKTVHGAFLVPLDCSLVECQESARSNCSSCYRWNCLRLKWEVRHDGRGEWLAGWPLVFEAWSSLTENLPAISIVVSGYLLQEFVFECTCACPLNHLGKVKVPVRIEYGQHHKFARHISIGMSKLHRLSCSAAIAAAVSKPSTPCQLLGAASQAFHGEGQLASGLLCQKWMVVAVVGCFVLRVSCLHFQFVPCDDMWWLVFTCLMFSAERQAQCLSLKSWQ